MKLRRCLPEHQAKQIFAKHGAGIPKGWQPLREVEKIAEKLGGKVVVKVQVLVGGRQRLPLSGRCAGITW
ncbi:ATP-grasp domain-containing protein [Archaeoglobus sp.]